MGEELKPGPKARRLKRGRDGEVSKEVAGVATEEFVLFTLFSSFVLLLNSFISVFNSVRLYFCFPAKECSLESLSCNIMNHRFSAYAPVSNSETTYMRSLEGNFCEMKVSTSSSFFFFSPKSCTKVL